MTILRLIFMYYHHTHPAHVGWIYNTDALMYFIWYVYMYLRIVISQTVKIVMVNVVYMYIYNYIYMHI